MSALEIHEHPWDDTDVSAQVEHAKQRGSATRYVVGNGGALLLGLFFAFMALRSSGAVGAAVTSLKISDFMSYYSALHLIMTGHGGSIYDFHALERVQAPLMHPLKMPAGFMPYYLYPPYFALAVSPLALLSFGAAYLVWAALTCILLAAALFILEGYAGLGRRGALLLRLAAVCFLPVFVTLLQGQVSILLLLLLVLVFHAARQERDVLAGAALACAVLKPPYVLPFLLVFLLQRRWRLLASFSLCALCLAAAPVAILGPSINQAYIHTLRESTAWIMHSRFIGYSPQGNQSIAGFTQLLLPSSVSTLATAALTLVALLVLAWSALRSYSGDLTLGLTVIVALLINPHVFIYDLTLLIIPAAVMLPFRRTGPRYVTALLVAAYVLVVVGYRLAFSYPIHLSVIAMVALGWWIVQAIERQRLEVAAAGDGRVSGLPR